MIGAGAALGGVFVTFVVWFYFSPKNTDVGYMPTQPVAYSHTLHAGTLEMDCRYCHQGVEVGPHATIPTTETCMNCHRSVLTGSAEVQKISAAHKAEQPIEWVKVHLLPDYAFFNHAAHVGAGVGCASCHGRVDQMDEVVQVEPLSMVWCLDCHRAPENHLRPLNEVTNMEFVVDPAQGKKLKAERQINPPTHCSACHR